MMRADTSAIEVQVAKTRPRRGVTIEGITTAAQMQGIPLGQECGQDLITNNNGGIME